MKDDFPKNLLEFEEYYKTEQDCIDYLFKLRWPDGFVCPRCKSKDSWKHSNGLSECRSCNLRTSVISGTILQDTKKPLKLWFYAIWHITSQKYGANALGMQRILGFGSYRTAWAWLHKLRRGMLRPERDKIDGIIQVDEIFIGGKKSGKRGRGSEGKTLVLVMVQLHGERIGRIRLSIIPNASSVSLNEKILESIEIGSKIQTDGWRGYNKLKKIGYIREVVESSASVGDDILPHCHMVASLLKRWLMGTLQGAVSPEHLAYYLDEFTFRFNRRTSKHRGKLFYRVLQNIVKIEPVPEKKLRKQARGRKPMRSN